MASKKFINDVKKGLEQNPFLYMKAWPTDILIYELNQNEKEALIVWDIDKKQKWFNLDKIEYCCNSWLGKNEKEANKKCKQYYQEFKKL